MKYLKLMGHKYKVAVVISTDSSFTFWNIKKGIKSKELTVSFSRH